MFDAFQYASGDEGLGCLFPQQEKIAPLLSRRWSAVSIGAGGLTIVFEPADNLIVVDNTGPGDGFAYH